MTAWHIEWKDSKGRHETSYSGKNAVMEHVEYCLNHGMSINSIRTVFGEGHNKRCVFPTKMRKTSGKDLDEEILAVLKENGQMTVLEIAKATNSSYRTDSMRRTTIRTRMYGLRDKGLVESVPNWDNESKWRLKE